jgi:hypothetical protein
MKFFTPETTETDNYLQIALFAAVIYLIVNVLQQTMK